MNDSASSESILLIDDIEDNLVTEEDLKKAEATCLKQNPVFSTNSVLVRQGRGKRRLSLPTADCTTFFGKSFSSHSESNKKSIDPRTIHTDKVDKSVNFKFGQPTTETSTVSSTSVSGRFKEGGFLSLTTGMDLSVKRTVRNDVAEPGVRSFFSAGGGMAQVRGSDSLSGSRGGILSVDKGILEMEEMKQAQEARIRAESEKMKKIERIIAVKKQQKMQQQNQNCKSLSRPGRAAWLLSETERLNMERRQMEEKMAEERRVLEGERRILEDQRKILELQQSVQNLERLVQGKQEMRNSLPVRERVGQIGGGATVGNLELEKIMQERKRRFEEGKSAKIVTEVGRKGKEKKKKYRNQGLPEELVLTEFTEHGPVPKGMFREEDQAEFHTSLPKELVLTEFGEDGPRSAKF